MKRVRTSRCLHCGQSRVSSAISGTSENKTAHTESDGSAPVASNAFSDIDLQWQAERAWASARTGKLRSWPEAVLIEGQVDFFLPGSEDAW